MASVSRCPTHIIIEKILRVSKIWTFRKSILGEAIQVPHSITPSSNIVGWLNGKCLNYNKLL